ncbi:MAG TPA: 3,4-dihydroxy-2-butanone-4-phosphate synthase, partial [Rhizorhapis sp.]|nr:3,4-dihydroxy-2-butanone-4-phosphate synthase [Rhizorhapis sp.]
VVLQKGKVNPDQPTLVRMHQLAPFSDLLGMDSPRSKLLSRSMEMIGEAGSGVVVLLNRNMPDAFTKLFRIHAGIETYNLEELRDYGVGAQILAELGVHDMILLTNSHHSLVALDGYDLAVVGERRID